jgi:tricorn protease
MFSPRILARVRRIGWVVAPMILLISLIDTSLGQSETAPLGPDANPLWLRYPAISPDGKTVAFIFRGHLFTVPSTGGAATALTAGPTHETSPVWSPDGQWIAFASDRYGHYDVYLVNAQGGPIRRLTSYSVDQIPTSFTPDNQSVLFSAHRMDSATSSKFPAGNLLPELYKVSIQPDRTPVLLLSTPALGAHYDRAGQRILYEDVKGYEDPWRKHETFANAHQIFLYDSNAKNFTQLTNYNGENRNPQWAPDERSIFYLSEQSGSFNIWQLPLASGATPKQLTHFDKNPVRFLSIAQDGTLCFGFDGEIYSVTHGNSNPQKLKIQIALAETKPNIEIKHLKEGATEMCLSPNGKEIAFVVRGDIYVVSVETGDTKRITNTPGQERSVSFSPDGKHLVFAAEYNKPWAIYEASMKESYFFAATDIQIRSIVENAQENFQPKYSPDGKEIAYLENRTTLRVINLTSKQIRTILPSKYNYSYEDGDQ